MSSINDAPRFEATDVQAGDWIRYRSAHYGSGRITEVHAIASDPHSGPYAVTAEGDVLFERILEIRRRPIKVVVLRRPLGHDRERAD
jgi:hypothetical protein